MTMTNGVYAEIKSEKGFYIGDICYVLLDRLYHDVWGEKHGYEAGTFMDPETGRHVAVAGTAYGDGTYAGSDGTEFPVDAGVIGLVPLELVKNSYGQEDGKVVEVPGTAIFSASDGKFEITTPDGNVLTIDTTWEPGYYDEDDEDFYEDDDDDWGDEEDDDE